MNLTHANIRIVLISLLLLSGQFGVLVHSAEHSFHTDEHACDMFLQGENLADGAIFAAFKAPAQLKNNQAKCRLVSVYLSSPPTNYFSRAPPQLP